MRSALRNNKQECLPKSSGVAVPASVMMRKHAFAFSRRLRVRAMSIPSTPSEKRECGTPGARCTLGPDADAVFRKGNASGLSESTSDCPAFRLRCFVGLLALCLSERSDHRIKVPRRWEGSLKRISRTRFDFGRPSHCPESLSIPRSAVSLPVAVLAQIRPARRQTSPLNRVTPHLRRPPHPTPRT